MRRIVLLCLALLLAAPPLPAQSQALPTHAWLFGTWTGGMFPPPSHMTPQACFSQPVVIFTRDVVLRATITDQFYTQRLIETALTSSGGTQFRFTSALPPVAVNGLLRSQSVAPPGVGFGCDSPDTLAVERRGENEIAFPGCADFPYPLVRCH